MFGKKDLIDRRGIASEKASKYEQRYADTGKDKYKNKAERYNGIVQGIDICLGKSKPINYNINNNQQKTAEIFSNNNGNRFTYGKK